MMGKSLTYAYPQRYAEGGEVEKDPYGRAYLSYEETSDPNKFKYTMYNYDGDVMQSAEVDRKYISNLFGANTVATGGNIGLQMVAPITDKENIQVLDDAGKQRILEGNFDYGYLQPESIASGGSGPDAYIGDDEGPVFQVVNPGSASGVAIAPSVPSGVEVPEGFKFAGMVDTRFDGPVASFTKLGDDTGFTIYAKENQFGTNKGKTGYYFDEVGEEAGSAGTGGYLDAEDAFNQGRTRSGNWVYHYEQMIDRGIKLDDADMEKLNAALAHHDKYLGGESGFESRRDNLIDTMSAVQNYENYGGAKYDISDEGAVLPKPDVFPGFGEITTMAVGEEDGGFPIDQITTMAMGEEEGSLPPIDEVTTTAVGEEDTSPAPFDPIYTTMAKGEEDDGGGMGGSDPLPFRPPADQLDPVPEPRPENPFLDLIPPAEVDPVTPITPAPRPENPFLGLPVPFDPPVAELPINTPVIPPVATTTAFGEEDGGMPPPVEQPRTYGEIPPTIQPVGRTYGNTNPFTGETLFNQMYQPVAVDATQALDPLREGLGTFLPGGAGNYANNPFMRPMNFSSGGEVPSWVDPDYGYTEGRKPNMREMMEHLSGRTVEDLYADPDSNWQQYSKAATEILYGSVGSNTDTRDFNKIMSAGSPGDTQAIKQAAGAATREMYNNQTRTEKELAQIKMDYAENGLSVNPITQNIAQVISFDPATKDYGTSLYMTDNQGVLLRQINQNTDPSIFGISEEEIANAREGMVDQSSLASYYNPPKAEELQQLLDMPDAGTDFSSLTGIPDLAGTQEVVADPFNQQTAQTPQGPTTVQTPGFASYGTGFQMNQSAPTQGTSFYEVPTMFGASNPIDGMMADTQRNQANPFMRPVGYSEGGSVKMTDINNGKNEQLGNDMVLLEFADGTKRMTQKALYEAAESLGAFDNMTNEKDFADWHLNTWAGGVVNDPQYKAAHDMFNTNQIAYNNALMEANPEIAKNRLAFVQQHAPNNTAALEAAQALVDQYSGISGIDAMQQDTANLSQRDTELNNGITAGTMGLISDNQPVQEEVETPTTISPFGDYMGYATGFDRGQGAGAGGGFYEVPTIFGSGLTTSADVATQDLNLLNRNPFRRPT